MCGIAGFYDLSRQSDNTTLIQITECLHHRGPDDTGYFFDNKKDYHVGLGHKRLSIIDVSHSGHQPMQFQHLTIVFNGEVYNYLEIKEELVQGGYTFHSTCDTEVILKAFHRWGEDAIAKFNGMFAIALYNTNSGELLLIRDRMGIKPLYYFYDGKNIAFSSELKSIIKYPGFSKEIDLSSLYTFLYHGYITSPRSIFKNVYKVNPGTYIKYKSGKIQNFTYWSLKDKFTECSKTIITDEVYALERLNELIKESIKYRMISDVPLGSFLSGGYDSSLVTAVMQHLSDRPVKTFTIGFHEKEYNEAGHARKVADYLKTDHHEQFLSIDETKQLIFEVPKYFDEPFADKSMLPTMLVSRFARQNVTVALSGDGGDELFCGYERYNRIKKYEKTRTLGLISNWLSSNSTIKKKLSQAGNGLNKLPYLGRLSSVINVDYLLSQYYLDGLILHKNFSIENQYLQISEDITCNLQEGYMLLDMLNYLPEDIMAKVDRASMAASLESREPLLDYKLVEFSFSLSHNLKYKIKEKKYLLKKLTHQYIPYELLNRPKMGFGLPIYDWLRGEMTYLIDKYLASNRIIKQGIFDDSQMQNVVDKFRLEKGGGKYSKLVWHLLMFQIWHEYYCE